MTVTLREKAPHACATCYRERTGQPLPIGTDDVRCPEHDAYEPDKYGSSAREYDDD